MPGNEFAQQQKIAQEQTLSARQLQSLELLYAPLLELQEKISAELENNPVLETAGSPAEELCGDLNGMLSSPLPEYDAGDDDSQAYGELYERTDNWRESLAQPGENDKNDTAELPPDWEAFRESAAEEWHDAAAGRQDASEQRRRHFFESLSAAPSLQNQLLAELALADLTPSQRRVAEMVIGSIDDTGYLHTHPADIAMAANAGLAEVEEMIALVQSFDPPGVGARDLAECLTLQLRRAGENDLRLYRLIGEFLDEIGKNHLPLIARKMNLEMPELRQLLDRIRRLNPFPGSALAPATENFVLPELAIVRGEHGFEVHADDSCMPRLHLSERYLQMLDDPALSAGDRSYIREKVAAARELLRALSQRKNTITRIAEVIMHGQQDFLENGIEHLKPMTMRQVADELGLHETTVSRAIANKYIETPQGIFEFRFFFSGGFQSESGEDVSSRAIKEKIRDFVDEEDPGRPLSDDKLSAMLKAEGLNVARRTVAKYRDELNILPSHLRRRH